MKKIVYCLSLFWLSLAHGQGDVIFLHPDGTGLGHWNAGRLLAVGPDGQLNWDKLDRLATYRSHQKGWLSTTSHAGATVHAYGKKVVPNSFGLDGQKPIQSASGFSGSIMQEAMAKGIRCGIVNTGHIAEPGSAVFLASSESRGDKTGIAKKIVESGADVIFCAGEIYFLPQGIKGVHGEFGVRSDHLDLLEEARGLGYTVIFTRQELLNLPPGTPKVLGVFAAEDTYNAKSEERLRKDQKETYEPAAPTFADMTRKALEILSSHPDKRFFLVAEEEGTDNFSNNMNAKGMLDAVLRADEGIGAALEFMEKNPKRKVFTMVASDSDAGHPSVWAPWQMDPENVLPPATLSGAVLDGVSGSGSRPFVSKPDAEGNAFAFGISWGYKVDMQGSTVAKAHGYRSDLLPSSLDNTGVFRILYTVLFEPETP